MATEPERVTDSNVDVPIPRGVGNVIEVAFGIWRF
jgi:hypothetical protein